MKTGRCLGPIIALALLFFGCSSPGTDTQTIQSGSLSAAATAEGALQIDRQTVRMQVSSPNPQTIESGESVTGLTTFVQHHEGDFYEPLSTYADLMAAQGVEMPSFPDTAYEPIWCAWGYGRNFESENILATIPKVQKLGLDWVVLDDGWQVAEGEWRPNPERLSARSSPGRRPPGSIRSPGWIGKTRQNSG